MQCIIICLFKDNVHKGKLFLFHRLGKDMKEGTRLTFWEIKLRILFFNSESRYYLVFICCRGGGGKINEGIHDGMDRHE